MSEAKIRNFIVEAFIFYLILVLFFAFLYLCAHFSLQIIVTLAGASIGPSVPAFRAVYLSRYTEQAEAFRKQSLLTDIGIRKEIKNERHEHYGLMLPGIEKTMGELQAIIEVTIKGTPTDSLSIHAQIFPDKIKNEDCFTNLKKHLEMERINGEPFLFDKLFKLAEDIPKFDSEVAKFLDTVKDEINKKIVNALNISVDENLGAPRSGGVISLETTSNVLAALWNEWISAQGSPSIDEFALKCVPVISIPTKNSTVGAWKIGTPYLTRNGLNISYCDTLSLNWKIYNAIRSIFLSSDFSDKFKKLALLGREIVDYVQNAKDLLNKVEDRIKDGNYNVVTDCCPYSELREMNG